MFHPHPPAPENPTPTQTLKTPSGEQHPGNWLIQYKKTYHTAVTWWTQSQILSLSWEDQNNLNDCYLKRIVCHSVHSLSCLKQHDENSAETGATLWHGRCQLKSCSPADWQQWHFMVGRHSFWVLCLKLDLLLCPSLMKCLNMVLDVSCYLWAFEFRHYFYMPFLTGHHWNRSGEK